MHEWLESAHAQLAGAVGEDVSAYRLTEGEIGELLELARIAAHDSGERTNAPLVCYLVGLAAGRHPDRGLAELAGAAAGKRA